jgi:2',3'-cyclic-nucleotide 2'-phosphodiesterase (5'-nucleotidase family)
MRYSFVIAPLASTILLLACASKESVSTLKATPQDATKLTLVYSTQLNGQLGDCGCNYDPKGGLEAREKYMKRLKEIAPDLIALDAGNSLFEGEDFKHPAKSNDQDMKDGKTLAEFQRKLGYAFQGIGKNEVKHGVGVLEQTLTGSKLVGLQSQIAKGAHNFEKFWLLERAGKKILFLSVAPQKIFKASKYDALPPLKAVKELVAAHTPDLTVILNSLNYDESRKLAGELRNLPNSFVLLGSSFSSKTNFPQADEGNVLWLDSASAYQSYGVLHLDLSGLKVGLPKAECKLGQSGIPELAQSCYGLVTTYTKR